MHHAVSIPSDIDACAELTARLALLDDGDGGVDWSNMRPMPPPKIKYAFRPRIKLFKVDADKDSARPAKAGGGIAKWASDRQIALKASNIKMLERKFERFMLAKEKAAKAEVAAQKKADKLAASGKPAPAPAPPAPVSAYRSTGSGGYQSAKAYERFLIAKRWQKFEHISGGKVADRDYAAFEEIVCILNSHQTTGIRSHNGSISTALFASRLPRLPRLAWGNDKEKLLKHDGLKRKIFILDAPYIELDPKRLGALVVDLDASWESEDALRADIEALLGPGCQPNLIACRPSEDGTLEMERPHLIWLTPPRLMKEDGTSVDGAVGTGGKSNQGLVAFFHAMHRALINALIPIGADIGHHNSLKIKNPLSPYWNLYIDDSRFISLSEWRGVLKMGVSEEEMHRRAEIHQAAAIEGATLDQSNHAWNTVLEIVRAALKHAHATKDRTQAPARRSYAAYYAWLLSKVEDKVIAALGDNRLAQRLLRRQIDYRAKNRKSKIRSQVTNRGRDRDLNTGKTVKQRQGDGGRNTQKAKVPRSIQAVADYVMATIDAGVPVVEAEVCNGIKTVSRATAYRHYKAALLVVSRTIGYIAKVQTADHSTSVPTPKVTRAKQSAPATPLRVPASASGRPSFLATPMFDLALALANKAKRQQEAGQKRDAVPAGPPRPAQPQIPESARAAYQESLRVIRERYDAELIRAKESRAAFYRAKFNTLH